MTDTLTLGALAPTRFKVRKTLEVTRIVDGEQVVELEPHEWTLNDNVGTGVSIWMAAIAPLFEVIESARLSGTALQIVTAQRELEERTLYLCLEIFRNGYPDMDEDFIRLNFSHDERWEIVQHFFTIRGINLQNAPGGGEATTGTAAATTIAPTVKHTPTPLASTPKRTRQARNPERELVEHLSD